MARQRVRSLHSTGAVLGATAMVLVGAPAPDLAVPELKLLTLPETSTTDSAPGPSLANGPGGVAMGKSVLAPGLHPFAKSGQSHKVRSGDTVWAIAAKYNTTVTKIIEANNLGSNALIRVGQTLTIPGTGSSSTATSTSKPSTSTSAAKKHTVKAGQSLSGIAATYGVTTATLASANKIANINLIHAGQILTIPGTGSSTSSAPASKPSKPAPSTPATATSHTVKAGDTVWALAQKYKTTTAAILSANNLKPDAVIRIGQRLSVPAPGAQSSSSSTSTQTNACKTLIPSTFLHYTYAPEVVAAANENKCTLDSMSVPSQNTIQQIVRETAQAMGVDPALAQAIAFQESSFNHRSVSPANAVGTMQVIPSSGQWAGDLLGRKINLLDPRDNIAAGVAILASLQKTFPNNLDHAIGSYYQGAGSVSQYGLASDTRNYVASVKAHMKRFM